MHNLQRGSSARTAVGRVSACNGMLMRYKLVLRYGDDGMICRFKIKAHRHEHHQGKIKPIKNPHASKSAHTSTQHA